MHLRRPLAVCLLLLLARGGALAEPPALDRSVPGEVAAVRLGDLARAVRALATSGHKPVVVFDIDDTLVTSNRNIIFDEATRPITGATRYVRLLARAGATIVYLTGRKTDTTQRTTAQLRRLGFPVGAGQELWLNPRPDRAVFFKASVRPLLIALGTPVAFFENEKENVRVFRRQYPEASVFRLNTRSAYRDPGRGARGVIVIDDYARGGRRSRGQAPRLRVNGAP